MPLTNAEERAAWLAYCIGALWPTSPAARMLLRRGLAVVGRGGLARLTRSGLAVAEQIAFGREPEGRG